MANKLFKQLERDSRAKEVLRAREKAAEHKAYGSAKSKPFPKNGKPQLWVVMADLHVPTHDRPSVAAVLDFVRKNRKTIHGLVLLGDVMDSENISHHTIGRPGLRKRGGFQEDIDICTRELLDPIDEMLPHAEKVFISGNHERFLTDFLESAPEFEGSLSWPKLLGLGNRGWTYIEQGGTFNIGPLILLHGDSVGSGQNIAKKVVDVYCASTMSGHVHSFNAATKCSEVKQKDRWVSMTIPCLTTLSPRYAKARPNAYLRGFGIVESYEGGRLFNAYVPIISEGKFCFAGRVYGA
ncbi:MAG TPA: metallophosphoesterase [Candidatus Sulfotelmatobacter sp.]